jgi:hypothetical protein
VSGSLKALEVCLSLVTAFISISVSAEPGQGSCTKTYDREDAVIKKFEEVTGPIVPSFWRFNNGTLISFRPEKDEIYAVLREASPEIKSKLTDKTMDRMGIPNIARIQKVVDAHALIAMNELKKGINFSAAFCLDGDVRSIEIKSVDDKTSTGRFELKPGENPGEFFLQGEFGGDPIVDVVRRENPPLPSAVAEKHPKKK